MSVVFGPVVENGVQRRAQVYRLDRRNVHRRTYRHFRFTLNDGDARHVNKKSTNNKQQTTNNNQTVHKVGLIMFIYYSLLIML